MFAWGSTINGELGLDDTEEVEHVLKPRKLEWFGADSVVEAACGDTHTLLLTKDGRVYSCGSNDYGQLGHDQPRKRPSTSLFNLVTDLDAHRITQITCGSYHSMALNQKGQVFTWGSDASGQLGHQSEQDVQATPKLLQALVALRVVQISCGQKHSMALTSGGEIYVWGANNYGQLGIRTVTPYESVPLTVSTLDGIPIASIACGGYHTFAVSRSGAVFGWGKNSQGQLGLNDTESKPLPNQLESLRNARVRYISCGHEFSAFLTLDGTIFTCGAGTHGQLGHGTVSNEILPRQVSELMGSKITQVSCGRTHTLALVASGERVYSFGFGAAGQLGIGSTSNATTPHLVQGPWLTPSGSNVVEFLQPHSIINRIFAGGDHCFATITESSNHTPFDYRQFLPETQILSLSYDYFSTYLNVPPNASVDQEMLVYLETIFRSVACINGSFLLLNEEHYCCTSQHHGVDLKLAQDTFSLIENLQFMKDVICNCITEVLLKKLSASPIDPETLRIYLILPIYNEFDNPENHYRLHKQFCSALLSLPSKESEVISDWLSSTTCDYFERLINIFKNVVSYIIRNQKIPPTGTIRDDPSLHDALEMLWFLYKINGKPESDPKLPCDTFYLPEVSEYIVTDYLLWVERQDSTTIIPNCIFCNNVDQRDEELFLCNYPFLLDASAKVRLLRINQLHNFHAELSEERPDIEFVPYELALHVTRENIVEDTLGQLLELSSFELRNPLLVSFSGEEAQDEGGVQKEFFVVFAEEILNPKYGLFKESEETGAIWFCFDSMMDNIPMFFLLGLIFGLAISNFNIINLPFPLALYKKLLGEPITLQDLKGLSPTVANSLNSLLNYEEPDLEEVFFINFEITCDIFGKIRSVPLKDDGDKIPVTQDNKYEYVELYVDFVFNTSVHEQYDAFSEGFRKVCGDDLSPLFRSQELMSVVVGNEDYDWDTFEEIAEYAEGYSRSDETIRWFWEVIREISLADKKKFLFFLTGCDRLPVGGMKTLKIEIRPMRNEKLLPVAHTCFNMLDLPRYKNKELLRHKLLQAIEQTRGFSLV